MENQLVKVVRVGWSLLRLIAVLSSSIVVILSSLLPLVLYSDISVSRFIFTFLFLSTTAIMFHGMLTHLLNDYTDYKTGTDAESPAILSGGSRVIQNGFLSPETVWKLGKWLALVLTVIAAAMAVIGRYDFTFFIVTGIWAAASYSLPPLQLSYRPIAGEWLSLFPAMFVLGIAGPWLLLESIPIWAIQNAFINSLVCMAWVMIHHIPDVEADRRAIPKKCTTVVWCKEKFGQKFTRLPAILYFFIAGICTIWVGFDRWVAGSLVFLFVVYAMYLVWHVKPDDINQVTTCEKILLLLAMLIAIALGIFMF